MKRLFLSITLLFCINFAEAQYVILGQEPARLRWYQIKTPHFQLIFPEDFSDRASLMANQLEYAYELDTKTLSFKPKKTKVILHTGSVESNAISLIVPTRAEFYMMPPQNMYAHGWQEQLVVHEYRHMVQLAKLRQGFTKVLSYPFGEYAQALTYGLFTPMWYMEGDAVVMETALSHSGRGRLPGFEMNMKVQLRDKGMYGFQKARLGSYKDNVPDQYNFGYHYMALCREKYGPGLWDKGMDQVARKPWMIAPLEFSFKKQAGVTKKSLYDTLFLDLSRRFKAIHAAVPLTSFTAVKTPAKKVYTHYKFPHYLNDSTLLAEKSGMADIPAFVTINLRNGQTQHICKPGFYASEALPAFSTVEIAGKNSPGAFTTDNLSLSDNKFCWAEKKYDPRWLFKNYSVVMIYDMQKGEKRQLTRQSNLFAPVFIPGTDSILAVEVMSDSACALVVLNPKGDIIQRVPNPKKDFYMIPAVSPDGRTIAVVAFNDKGKSIQLIDRLSGEARTILDPTFEEISAPCWYQHYVFYTSSVSGTDNIYAIDIQNNKRYQVTSSATGAYQPDFSPDGKKIAYSQYTAKGYEIVETALDPSRWKPAEHVEYQSIALYKSFLAQEDGILDRAHSPTVQYDIKPYRKGAHLFNLHSWAPAYFSVNDALLRPGVSFASQNMLSTSILSAGYTYITEENSGYYFLDYTYAGFYPVLDLSVNRGKRELQYLESGLQQQFQWRETSASLGIGIPLVSTWGSFYQKWDFHVNLAYYETENTGDGEIRIYDQFNTLEPGFSFTNIRKSVLRDMATRWGQSFRLNYYISPDQEYVRELAGQADLYFPGLVRHHSLKLGIDAMKRSIHSYPFRETVRFPRGYQSNYHDEYWKISGDYKFPVLYPDMAAGSVFYMKRLKFDVFYDYGEGSNPTEQMTYRSFGYELSADFNFFGFFLPVNLGFRHSYLPVEKENHFDLLMSVSFDGM